MKNFTLLLVLVFGVGAAAYAQDAEDRIEALKIAFITEKLQLTPEESQQFWPIFNEYTNEREKLRTQGKPDRPVQDMSEAEAEKFLAEYLDLEQRELDLKRNYMLRLKNVLPAKKIALLGAAERQFKEKLLERIKKRQQGRMRPGG
ncbi:MAG: hypothetical protein R2769_03205 [Saprospiraceae bacterium]